MGIFSLSSLKVCVNDTPKLNNISHFALEYDTWRTWKTAAAALLQPRSLARSEKQAKEPLSATIYHYES